MAPLILGSIITEPVSELSLREAFSRPVFMVSDGSHPVGASMSISSEPDLLRIWKKYVRLTSQASASLTDAIVGIDDKTLGVHFRGNEMRTAAWHPFPMTLRQCLGIIREQLDSADFDRILLVTEGQQYLRYFRRAFGSRLIATDTFRLWHRNSYRHYPRELHRYKLGLETLIDGHALAACGGLVCSSSNLSEFSILLNEGQYKRLIEVRNGTNSSSRVSALFSWYVHAAFPLGTVFGFTNVVNQKTK